MRKILVLFLCFSLVFPSWAQENEDSQNDWVDAFNLLDRFENRLNEVEKERLTLKENLGLSLDTMKEFEQQLKLISDAHWEFVSESELRWNELKESSEKMLKDTTAEYEKALQQSKSQVAFWRIVSIVLGAATLGLTIGHIVR